MEDHNELVEAGEEFTRVHQDPDKPEGFIQYEGFWYTPPVLEGIKFAQTEFKAQPSDIVLCSAPKSGTTWLKALAFAIVTRKNSGNDESNPNVLLTSNPHECVQFLESPTITALHNQGSAFDRNLLKPPNIFATHIPYTSLPTSISTEPRCKIVYLCRNPKDVFVSYWHFFGKNDFQSYENKSMENDFETFCKGITVCGPVWDHILGYWKASQEKPEMVMFLTYEDLKSQTALHVKRLAEFMGQPFSEEEERQGEVVKIIEICNIQNMRNLEVNKTGKCTMSGFEVKNHSFFRKGEVGDWKNCLTTDMIKRLDQITEDKFTSSGLKFT